MEPKLFAALLESVRQAFPPHTGNAGLLWWRFTCEPMDYTASPDWYGHGP